jgi:hypothetical protein
MADTNHHHAPSPLKVEGDGVSYSGTFWFVVVLTVTTVACQLLVVGLFAYLDHLSPANASPRSPRLPAGQLPPRPTCSDEPGNLKTFKDTGIHAHELWLGRSGDGNGPPPDRSRGDLIIERGLPGEARNRRQEATKGKQHEGTEKG